METLTVIYFPPDLHNSYAIKLEKIQKKHNLILNKNKTTQLTLKEIDEIYMLFGYKEDEVNALENIKNKFPCSANVGNSVISENGNEAIKTIAFNIFNNYSYPHLMIYKGIEGSFYKEFLTFCIGIGCTISKVIIKNGNCEEIFRRQQDIAQVNEFKRSEDRKDVMKEIFVSKMRELKTIWNFDNSFVINWKELIEKYGI